MENLKGSNYSWGLIAKIFHWGLAVFILFQILIGINLHFMDPSTLKGDLIHYHKIFGTLIILLVFLRLAWKFYNPSPKHHKLSLVHKIGSNIVHSFLYLLIIVLPIQGMFLTWVAGSDVLVLGVFKLPRLIEEDFILHEEYLIVHFWLTIALLTLFLIHLSASFLHIFIYKDKYEIWKSMRMFKRN